VPNHVCATMNLHDKVYGIRNGVVEREITVDARGRVN
jgi:D-serine deaminase-like pyridoxal phosphate-dependent protein